jgi:hypothetical protein
MPSGFIGSNRPTASSMASLLTRMPAAYASIAVSMCPRNHDT